MLFNTIKAITEYFAVLPAQTHLLVGQAEQSAGQQYQQKWDTANLWLQPGVWVSENQEWMFNTFMTWMTLRTIDVAIFGYFGYSIY